MPPCRLMRDEGLLSQTVPISVAKRGLFMRTRIAFLTIVAVVAVFIPSLISDVLAGPPNVGANDHVDERFDWRWSAVEYADGSSIYLYWYPGSIDAANLDGEEWLADLYLSRVSQTGTSMELLTGTDINHDLHIYIYRDWETMRQFYPSATPYASGVPLPIDGEDELPAFAVDGDTILAHSDGDNRVSGKYLQHELAHLVLKEALWLPSKGTYAKAPVWLDEGLAQLSEYRAHHDNYSLSHLKRWFLTGNRLAPVCGMTDYPSDDDDYYFYIKPLALTTILANEGDYRTFAEFIGKLRRGWALEWALNSTFGLSQYDLERRWLKFADLDDFVPSVYCSVPTDTTPAPPSEHEDTRFTWQTRTRGLVTLHWYEDATVDDPFRSYDVDYMLAEANDAVKQMQSLLGVTVTEPMHIWVYSRWEELAPHYRGEGPPPAGFARWRKGNSLAFVDSSRQGTTDIGRHEVAHLVASETLVFHTDMWESERDTFDYRLWLNEGVATQTERLRPYSTSDYTEWLAEGGRNTPICGMTEYPLDETAKDHFYGKSFLVTRHLVETGEAAGMAELVQRIGVGDDIDAALTAAFGLTQHDLEEYWLGLIGLDQTAERCAT